MGPAGDERALAHARARRAGARTCAQPPGGRAVKGACARARPPGGRTHMRTPAGLAGGEGSLRTRTPSGRAHEHARRARTRTRTPARVGGEESVGLTFHSVGRSL